MQWPSKDEDSDSTSPVHMPPKENRTPDVDGDIFDNKIYCKLTHGFYSGIIAYEFFL